MKKKKKNDNKDVRVESYLELATTNYDKKKPTKLTSLFDRPRLTTTHLFIYIYWHFPRGEPHPPRTAGLLPPAPGPFVPDKRRRRRRIIINVITCVMWNFQFSIFNLSLFFFFFFWKNLKRFSCIVSYRYRAHTHTQYFFWCPWMSLLLISLLKRRKKEEEQKKKKKKRETNRSIYL